MGRFIDENGPWLFFAGVVLAVFVFWIISAIRRRGQPIAEERDAWGWTLMFGPLGMLHAMNKHKRLKKARRLARKANRKRRPPQAK